MWLCRGREINIAMRREGSHAEEMELMLTGGERVSMLPGEGNLRWHVEGKNLYLSVSRRELVLSLGGRAFMLAGRREQEWREQERREQGWREQGWREQGRRDSAKGRKEGDGPRISRKKGENINL